MAKSRLIGSYPVIDLLSMEEEELWMYVDLWKSRP